MIRRLSFLIALALGGGASAQPLFGVQANSLYTFDYGTGATTLLGSFTLKANHLFAVIARAPDGKLLGVASSVFTGSSTLYEFDEQTGQATPLFDFPTDTFFLVSGCAVDPFTGVVYVLNGPTLVSIDPLTGTKKNVGAIGPANSFEGLAFDSGGALYTLEMGAQALWSVDPVNPANSGPVGNGLGTLFLGATLTYDPFLGSLVGYHLVAAQPFLINATTGLAGPPSAATSPSMAYLAGSACPGRVTTYGAGCAAGAAKAPVLSIGGCPKPGNLVSLEIDDALGGSTALLVFGTAQGSVPIGFGCSLLAHPLLPLSLALPLGGAGPGNGGLVLTATIPAQTSAAVFTMQAFVLDAQSLLGFTATNGIEIEIP